MIDDIAETCDDADMSDITTLSRYPGGKGLAFREIINLMPPHERYIETHLGSGAVYRNKRPADASVGIDLDPNVIARWRSNALGHGIRVIEGDAVSILPELSPAPGDLVYCDPPYHPDTRRRGRCYQYDYDVPEHERLLSLLVRLPCPVVVSGYRSELYDDVLSVWTRTDYQTLTHTGQVTESAWTNFRPGPPLHDYRHIGSDFREREQLRRRASSLSRRIARAAPMELHAALANLAAAHPEAVLAAAERIRR
ncbi:DNA adenine methylase [Sphingomonas sp. PAMC26645]|uniref:DNA adenine methylase n=1 Tax=Sphingomonas sp. PAMC26645 TaxID=2565555 RepID=UPI00109E2A0A|nr:DNA adenine methylase [Sphingomonas sp. PAMC26645]QCB43331.1 DNA adenine methylase [Sphingomonas sp. PAMC26645]